MQSASQRIVPFLFRRFLCSVLIYVGVISTLCTLTSIYYVVRINSEERSGPSSSAAWNKRRESASQRLPENGVVQLEAILRDTDGAAHDTSLADAAFSTRRRRTIVAPYCYPYDTLAVGRPRTRQRVRNPSFPAHIPLWEDDEVEGDAQVPGARVAHVAVPPSRRYVLNGLKAGDQYQARLSFLGSSSVAFDLVLYEVRCSRIRSCSDDAREEEHGWRTRPQDTELLVFSMQRDNALQFSAKEVVLADDDTGACDTGDTCEGAVLRCTALATDTPDDPYLPVLEVRPRALAIPLDIHRVPVVRFNIELEQLNAFLLPRIAVPLILYSVWALVFVGYFCVYTLVSSSISSGVDSPHSHAE